MYTPRGRVRAAPPRARPAGSPRRRARPPRCGASAPRSGGVGTSSAAQLLDQALDPRRVGLRRGRGRAPAPARARAAAATCSLVRIISRSIRRCASVCGDAAGADDVAVGVEAELRLARLDVEAGRAAALAERRGGLAGDRERLGDRAPAARAAAGEDRVELVVVEAGVGADPAAVEARALRARRRRRARSRPSPPAARRRAPGCRRRR